MTPRQPKCEHCHDTGEVFGHSKDCRDDLCALNGDIHSCNGEVVACGCDAGRAYGENVDGRQP